jgi:hypothetical protein
MILGGRWTTLRNRRARSEGPFADRSTYVQLISHGTAKRSTSTP